MLVLPDIMLVILLTNIIIMIACRITSIIEVLMSSDIELYEKKYPANWIVMQNKISQAFKDMTIDEKRIIMLASSIARVKDATEQTAIEITAKDFSEACTLNKKSVYQQLKDASYNLMKRSFSYVDEKNRKVAVQWVIRTRYEDGFISIYFPSEVLYMLKVFDKFNPYTKYKKSDVLSLKLNYSIDLYHLAKKYEGMGGFSISLDDYRGQLQTPDSYDKINNLKSNAVDKPIKEINEKTDITITYENVKRGRTVVGLKFTVKAKPTLTIKDAKQNTVSIVTVADLKDKQIEALVCTEAFKADYNHLISASSPVNTDYKLWQPTMSKRLKDEPELFNKRPIQFYLNQIGDYKNKS